MPHSEIDSPHFELRVLDKGGKETLFRAKMQDRIVEKCVDCLLAENSVIFRAEGAYFSPAELSLIRPLAEKFAFERKGENPNDFAFAFFSKKFGPQKAKWAAAVFIQMLAALESAAAALLAQKRAIEKNRERTRERDKKKKIKKIAFSFARNKENSYICISRNNKKKLRP